MIHHIKSLEIPIDWMLTKLGHKVHRNYSDLNLSLVSTIAMNLCRKTQHIVIIMKPILIVIWELERPIRLYLSTWEQTKLILTLIIRNNRICQADLCLDPRAQVTPWIRRGPLRLTLTKIVAPVDTQVVLQQPLLAYLNRFSTVTTIWTKALIVKRFPNPKV